MTGGTGTAGVDWNLVVVAGQLTGGGVGHVRPGQALDTGQRPGTDTPVETRDGIDMDADWGPHGAATAHCIVGSTKLHLPATAHSTSASIWCKRYGVQVHVAVKFWT